MSEAGFDVQPYLDRLVPSISALLSGFDRVNQLTEDVHKLEVKLEEAQTRRRRRWISNKEERVREPAKTKQLSREDKQVVTGEYRVRTSGVFYPKPPVSLPASFSFSASTPVCCESELVLPQVSSSIHSSGAAELASGIYSLHPAGFPGIGWIPRRRAWHSGSSHSADAAGRAFVRPEGAVPSGHGEENVRQMSTRPRSEEGVRRRVSDGVPVKRKAWISEGPETEAT